MAKVSPGPDLDLPPDPDPDPNPNPDFDLESQELGSTTSQSNAWSRPLHPPSSSQSVTTEDVASNVRRLKKLGITVVRDWDQTSLGRRGLVGIRKNAFVDHEGNALKVQSLPQIGLGAYVPAKLCRDKVEKAIDKVDRLQRACISAAEEFEAQEAQEQAQQLANHAFSFEVLKRRSLKCIQHYKEKLAVLEEDLQKAAKREQQLSKQLEELNESHVLKVKQVEEDAGREHSNRIPLYEKALA